MSIFMNPGLIEFKWLHFDATFAQFSLGFHISRTRPMSLNKFKCMEICKHFIQGLLPAQLKGKIPKPISSEKCLHIYMNLYSLPVSVCSIEINSWIKNSCAYTFSLSWIDTFCYHSLPVVLSFIDINPRLLRCIFSTQLVITYICIDHQVRTGQLLVIWNYSYFYIEGHEAISLILHFQWSIHCHTLSSILMLKYISTFHSHVNMQTIFNYKCWWNFVWKMHAYCHQLLQDFGWTIDLCEYGFRY